MQTAGLFRVLQPKRWGGYEMDLRTYFEVQLALGEGDMSVAWIYGVVGVHPWLLALLDEYTPHFQHRENTGLEFFVVADQFADARLIGRRRDFAEFEPERPQRSPDLVIRSNTLVQQEAPVVEQHP